MVNFFRSRNMDARLSHARLAGMVTGPNGMIWISYAPSGADVYVDRAMAGITPLQSLGRPAGFH